MRGLFVCRATWNNTCWHTRSATCHLTCSRASHLYRRCRRWRIFRRVRRLQDHWVTTGVPLWIACRPPPHRIRQPQRVLRRRLSPPPHRCRLQKRLQSPRLQLRRNLPIWGWNERLLKAKPFYRSRRDNQVNIGDGMYTNRPIPLYHHPLTLGRCAATNLRTRGNY